MQKLKKWVVCLDLSNMDDAVISYLDFFASVHKPESIEFLHVVQSYNVFAELVEEFPELESEEELNKIIVEQLGKKVKAKFTHDDVATSFTIKKGSATNNIIKMMEKNVPDLLVMGKKGSYKGQGVLATRIAKYVPCSILFVPELARPNLKNITVPVDFSEQSEVAASFALDLVGSPGGQVVAQHIYRHDSQFFPYMPDKASLQKQEKKIAEKKKAFLDKIKAEKGTELSLEVTLHEDGTYSDDIYDLAVSNNTDMILVFSKARGNLMSLVTDTLADLMVNYYFGVPMLVLKNKEKNKKFFQSFLKS